MNNDSSKQFDEIMGRNFTPQMQKRMEKRATQGAADDLDDSGLETYVNIDSGLSRMSDFPHHMITSDDSGQYRVEYKSPRGWTHTWNGGPYIEHHHPVHGVIDVTNMHDYSLPSTGNSQSYQKGLSLNEFMGRVGEFEKNAEKDYPKDYLP